MKAKLFVHHTWKRVPMLLGEVQLLDISAAGVAYFTVSHHWSRDGLLASLRRSSKAAKFRRFSVKCPKTTHRGSRSMTFLGLVMRVRLDGETVHYELGVRRDQLAELGTLSIGGLRPPIRS